VPLMVLVGSGTAFALPVAFIFSPQFMDSPVLAGCRSAYFGAESVLDGITHKSVDRF